MSRVLIRERRESAAHWNRRGVPQCCCGCHVGRVRVAALALPRQIVH